MENIMEKIIGICSKNSEISISIESILMVLVSIVIMILILISSDLKNKYSPLLLRDLFWWKYFLKFKKDPSMNNDSMAIAISHLIKTGDEVPIRYAKSWLTSEDLSIWERVLSEFPKSRIKNKLLLFMAS